MASDALASTEVLQFHAAESTPSSVADLPSNGSTSSATPALTRSELTFCVRRSHDPSGFNKFNACGSDDAGLSISDRKPVNAFELRLTRLIASPLFN
jgi:hypothetical protein